MPDGLGCVEVGIRSSARLFFDDVVPVPIHDRRKFDDGFPSLFEIRYGDEDDGRR